MAFAKKVAVAFGWKETFQKDQGFLPQTCLKKKKVAQSVIKLFEVIHCRFFELYDTIKAINI